MIPGEALVALWAIQQLDSELDTLRTKTAEIPRKIEGLNLAASEEKQQLEAGRLRVVDLKKRYKLIEVDVKETDEKVNTKSAQLYGAKTNEIYKAFLKEIEGLQGSKRSQEDEMVGLMEELETAEAAVKRLEKESAAIEQETRERVATLERELRELEAAVAGRSAEREKLFAGLDKGMGGTYERIRKGKRGIAAVSVTGDRCNGCLIPIPPQTLIEVGRRDRLHFCEHCGRILVPPDIA
jgi:hypothetical protein